MDKPLVVFLAVAGAGMLVAHRVRRLRRRWRREVWQVATEGMPTP